MKKFTSFVLMSLTAVLPLAAVNVVAPAPTAAVSHWSGGGVTISGASWLGGKGVNVYRSRQCTELAVRLYASKGWGSLNNIYSSRPSDRRVTFFPSGRGYRPVPGDVVLEAGGSYGHVAVVTRVSGNAVFTVEQNAAPNGRKTYTLRGKKLKAFGAYSNRYVKGFLHSKKNPAGKPAVVKSP